MHNADTMLYTAHAFTDDKDKADDKPRNPVPKGFKPWEKGKSGNPFGRRPGAKNKTTVEAKAAATELVDNPAYREALAKRLLEGTAGPMEQLLWHYAKGKPVDRQETGGPGAFTDLTDDELKARILEVARKL